MNDLLQSVETAAMPSEKNGGQASKSDKGQPREKRQVERLTQADVDGILLQHTSHDIAIEEEDVLDLVASVSSFYWYT